MATLRAKQVQSIQRMLNLNKDVQSFSKTEFDSEIIWKVLVLDKKSTNIVSSILSVNDLLECGITMHTLINSPNRSELPDVPAIYFLEPSKENIEMIVKDVETDFYDSYYINFLSTIDRSLLEEFANLVSLTGKSSKVAQVFDQYLDYLVTEPQLFSLEVPDVYYNLNRPSITEDDVANISETIATGLFNVIITLDTIPIIRAPSGGPAELVAQKLDAKLRDHVINMKSVQVHGGSNNILSANPSSSNLNQCVLVLLDRNIDLSSMFAHSWIYSCMVNDIFNLDRNSITVEKIENEKTVKTKYYIETNDFFWSQNSSLPFPDAVENIEKESNDYKQTAAEITSKTGVTTLSDIDPSQSDTYQIQQAIKQLPKLTARKQVIDTHMSILEALLKELQSKNLDVFFEFEQNCKNANYGLKKLENEFLTKLNEDDSAINKMDKLRTYLIMYLSHDLSPEFCKKVEHKLESLGCDLTVLTYIKRVKEFLKLTSMTIDNSNDNYASSSTNSNNAALFSGLSNKLFELTETSKIGTGLGSLVSGIKNLLPGKQSMPITNLVESIVEPSISSQITLSTTDEYLYFNPHEIRGNHSKIPKRHSYNQAIVFVVGGGNYNEYQNLQEWVSTMNQDTNTTGIKRNIIYGSNDIVNARKFIEECAKLGQANSGSS